MPTPTAHSLAADMTTGLRCATCGHDNQLEARFCSSCGAVLVGDSRTATVAIEVVEISDEFAVDRSQFPESQGIFMVTRGPNQGARYLLDADHLSIGRSPDSEIFLDDVTVSRNHALLEYDGGDYTISDQNSLNGTYLNRERIERASLADGDEVQIGLFRLVFFHGTRS